MPGEQRHRQRGRRAGDHATASARHRHSGDRAARSGSHRPPSYATPRTHRNARERGPDTTAPLPSAAPHRRQPVGHFPRCRSPQRGPARAGGGLPKVPLWFHRRVLSLPQGVVVRVRSWLAGRGGACWHRVGLGRVCGWACRRPLAGRWSRARSWGGFGRHTFALEVPPSNIKVVRESNSRVFESRTASSSARERSGTLANAGVNAVAATVYFAGFQLEVDSVRHWADRQGCRMS